MEIYKNLPGAIKKIIIILLVILIIFMLMQIVFLFDWINMNIFLEDLYGKKFDVQWPSYQLGQGYSGMLDGIWSEANFYEKGEADVYCVRRRMFRGTYVDDYDKFKSKKIIENYTHELMKETSANEYMAYLDAYVDINYNKNFDFKNINAKNILENAEVSIYIVLILPGEFSLKQAELIYDAMVILDSIHSSYSDISVETLFREKKIRFDIEQVDYNNITNSNEMYKLCIQKINKRI